LGRCDPWHLLGPGWRTHQRVWHQKVYIANTIESNQERAQILSIAPIIADYLRSKYLARK
jgi:hypothetical protein